MIKWLFLAEENLLGRDIGGLFVLNIVQEIVNNASISNFAYSVESINSWHGRLCHVNFSSIKMLKKWN